MNQSINQSIINQYFLYNLLRRIIALGCSIAITMTTKTTTMDTVSETRRQMLHGQNKAYSRSMHFLKTVVILVVVSVASLCSTSRTPTVVAFQSNRYRCHNLNRRQHSFQGQGSEQRILQCNGNRNDNDEGRDDSAGTKEDMNILTKSSWYAVELFGNVFGKNDQSEDSSETTVLQSSSSSAPISLDETIKRINDDNDRDYFLSGEVDSYIYDVDCVFADPFVSFSGRDRFVQNLQNLGSFITKYDARVLKYSDVIYRDDDSNIPIVETKIMVKLELNLPWKPVLAWPWGVTYEIDPETFLITKHEESWNIEPLEGVKMIFRPPTLKL